MDNYKEQVVGSLQQKMLYVKYEKTYWKMKYALENGNYPMYEIYKRQVDTMRMTISILGVNIKDING